MIWFTADLHFWHRNIIKYTGRPFGTVDEMNEIMVHRWNSVVKEDHTIYVLGDFAFASASKIKNLLSCLNGRKILIIGNHDMTYTKHKWVKMGFNRVNFRETIEIVGQQVELAHYPVYTAGKWMLHGHVHDRWRVRENKFYAGGRLNVGVDVWDFLPISINAIGKVIRGVTRLDNLRCKPYGGDDENSKPVSPFYDDDDVTNDFSPVDTSA